MACEKEIVNKNALRRMSVKTPLGDLVVETSTDLDYPGVWISLHRDGEDYEPTLALVEYTATGTGQDSPALVTRVWGDGTQEDYTDRIVHRGFEECFRAKEVEENG